MVGWKEYPPIQIESPVLALAAGQGLVWAGGAGGVSRYGPPWVSCSTGLPLASVAALAFASGWLFAGGADGLARSKDGGETWLRGVVHDVFQPVICLAVSPTYDQDFTVLAGTLGGGILRSEDAGRTWKTANFGIQNYEVLSLAWSTTGTILAGTSDGIYRSTNAGRAWRATDGSEGLSASGLAILPDGRALASIENGGLLSSVNFGATWINFEPQEPIEGLITAMIGLTNSKVLMSVLGSGTFQTLDGGKTWHKIMDQAAICFAAGSESVYAGIGDDPRYGVIELIRDSVQPLPPPLLHDLRLLTLVDQVPVVAGLHSGAFIWRKKIWQPLLEEGAVTALVQAPDGSLIVSCEQGLLRSVDVGKTWQTILEGESGVMARLIFRSDGQGWAASGDGARLLHTRDNGKSWVMLNPPFGVLPLAALQATNHELIAATYDARGQIAQIWYSLDSGETWKRGLEAQTPWPIVTVAGHPPLLTLGGVIFVLHPKGNWVQHTIRPGAGVRRVAGRSTLILALTTHGLFRSTDRGKAWSEEPDCPPVAEILDLMIGEDRLFLLLTGGRVWSRPLVAG